MRDILIIVDNEYEWWAKKASRSKVLVASVGTVADVVRVLESFNGRTFRAVAFCPKHGAENNPFVVFGNENMNLFDCITYGKLLSTNIHFCSCHSGKFFAELITHFPEITSLTGYRGFIGGGDKVEAFQLKYIEDGCKNRNKFIKSKDNFVHYSFSKVKHRVTLN